MGEVDEDALGLVGAVLGREGVAGEDVAVEVVLGLEGVHQGVELYECHKGVC